MAGKLTQEQMQLLRRFALAIEDLGGSEALQDVMDLLARLPDLEEADEADELGSVAHGKTGVLPMPEVWPEEPALANTQRDAGGGLVGFMRGVKHRVDRFGRLVLVDPWKTDGE